MNLITFTHYLTVFLQKLDNFQIQLSHYLYFALFLLQQQYGLAMQCILQKQMTKMPEKEMEIQPIAAKKLTRSQKGMLNSCTHGDLMQCQRGSIFRDTIIVTWQREGQGTMGRIIRGSTMFRSGIS